MIFLFFSFLFFFKCIYVDVCLQNANQYYGKKMKLFSKYSTISSFHLWLFSFAVGTIYLHSKRISPQLQTWMTLFTNFTHAHKHLFWPALPGCYDDMKKIHAGEKGLFICKNEISAVKNIPPGRDKIILHVIRNVFFSGKCYLNWISSN